MAAASGAAARREREAIPPYGWLFMALLAVQFATEPYLRKHSTESNALVTLLTTESLKVVVGTFTLALRRGPTGGARTGRLVLISLLYTVQDWCVLQATAPASGCSPLLFQLLNQTKVLFAALGTRVVIGTRRSGAQWLALCLLALAAAIIVTQPTTAASTPLSLRMSPGVMAALASAVLSGCSQTLAELTLRSGEMDPLRFTRDMAITKVAILLATAVASSSQTGKRSSGHPAAWQRLPAQSAWPAIALSTSAGFLVAQVTKHAGGDGKGYALVTGLVCSTVYSGGRGSSRDTQLGAALVVVSVTLWHVGL